MRALAEIMAAGRADPIGPGRAIGYVGQGVPLEVIHAAGARPVMLPATPGPTPDADRYLERGFSFAARSILQQWIGGRFDRLEAIVLPRSSDNAQRLYYYACELRRRGLLAGPEPVLFDLALIGRETSARHSADAVTRLAAALGAADVAAGIAPANRRRDAFARIDALREDDAPPPGSLVTEILWAAGLCEPETFDLALDRAELPRFAGKRLLFVGSPPPDDALHRAAEASGATFVGERHEFALDRHGPKVTEASAAGIAASLRAGRLGTRTFADRVADMREHARRLRVDGIVLWLVEEEEALVWDLPPQIAAARDMGLPVLALTRRDARDTRADEAAIRDFAGSLT